MLKNVPQVEENFAVLDKIGSGESLNLSYNESNNTVTSYHAEDIVLHDQ